MIISRHLFLFLIFRVVRGVKVQKMSQNYKKSVCRALFQKPYIIWSSFTVHICIMIISPGIFPFFNNLDFFWLFMVVKGKKKRSKMTKPSLCLTVYHRNRTSHDWDFWYPFVKWWCLQEFFVFSKCWLFWLFMVVKGQKKTQKDQWRSATLYISGTVDHIIEIFGTQV